VRLSKRIPSIYLFISKKDMDSNVDSYSQRLKVADEALGTDLLRNQLAAWTEQRNVLRTTVSELWHGESGSANGGEFKVWWNSVHDDLRSALLITALEDLPNQTSLASLITFVCPELLDLEALMEENGIQVAKIIQILVEQRENDPDIYNFSALEENFEEDARPSATASNSMKLGRSCILLTFAADVLLVYESERTGSLEH
jgi:hypothetical protein